MPDYREIFNGLVTNDNDYNFAERSPGLRAAMARREQLKMLSGRSLDVGCGVGFVLEYLSEPGFDLLTFGVDVSDVAISFAKKRMTHVPGSGKRLKVIEDQRLPFDDDSFALVTCFSMLQHLEEAAIDAMLEEIHRVLRTRSLLLISVTTNNIDQANGDPIASKQSVDWWLDKTQPDGAEYDCHQKQLLMWKHGRTVDESRDKVQFAPRRKLETTEKEIAAVVPDGSEVIGGHPKDSSALYQQIYDENPWYGNAAEDRCPGVRLLPEYQEWLISPVIDLGCGRGHTVDRLLELGMKAEGIDQIQVNPRMRVGDITKPIEGMAEFQSAVCIDCIEHLYEEQVLGLFENMKQVKRQAFSIHNGESSGTGQELHVNRKSFLDWTKLIREHFDVATAIQISEEQILYLTQTKT